MCPTCGLRTNHYTSLVHLIALRRRFELKSLLTKCTEIIIYIYFFFYLSLCFISGKNTPQILTGRQCGFNTDGKQQQQQQRNHKDSSHSLPHLHSLGPPPPPCTGRRPAGQAVVRSGPRRPDSPCTPLWRLLTWAGCCTCSSPDLRCTAPLEDTSVKDKNLCY